MDVVLTQPRGFCAGVVRAIEIVETALEIFGSPVYVVHEIVHNQRVVEDLRSRGAIFVESLDEVPDGCVTIFSAHGVPESMIKRATGRDLEVIDATCPLVTKVHIDVIRNAREGREVILIGHAGHPEVNGTLGHYDRSFGGEMYLVQ
ncbi:MAG: 4-hydroxy-3-methylbut-2-enyl diphosphate reductase, partial [Methylococcales bacterium]